MVGVRFQSECYPSHRGVNNLGKINQEIAWDFSSWNLWGTALFPHKSWIFKDKILRQLINTVSASWGELESTNEKKREKQSWSIETQRQTETRGLRFATWRPLDPLFSHHCLSLVPWDKKSLYGWKHLELSFCHFNQAFLLLRNSWPLLKPGCFPIPVFLVLARRLLRHPAFINMQHPWFSQPWEWVYHSHQDLSFKGTDLWLNSSSLQTNYLA